MQAFSVEENAASVYLTILPRSSSSLPVYTVVYRLSIIIICKLEETGRMIPQEPVLALQSRAVPAVRLPYTKRRFPRVNGRRGRIPLHLYRAFRSGSATGFDSFLFILPVAMLGTTSLLCFSRRETSPDASACRSGSCAATDGRPTVAPTFLFRESPQGRPSAVRFLFPMRQAQCLIFTAWPPSRP